MAPGDPKAELHNLIFDLSEILKTNCKAVKKVKCIESIIRDKQIMHKVKSLYVYTDTSEGKS